MSSCWENRLAGSRAASLGQRHDSDNSAWGELGGRLCRPFACLLGQCCVQGYRGLPFGILVWIALPVWARFGYVSRSTVANFSFYAKRVTMVHHTSAFANLRGPRADSGMRGRTMTRESAASQPPRGHCAHLGRDQCAAGANHDRHWAATRHPKWLVRCPKRSIGFARRRHCALSRRGVRSRRCL